MQAKYREILQNSSVLIVEDKKELREYFQEVLSLYLQTVYVAKDGQEALEIFQNETINMIFSDINMPNMDGLELSKRLRALDENVPIVIITAHTEQELLLEFIKLHLIEYIIKPIKYEKLIEILENCARVLETKSLLKFRLSHNCFYDQTNKVLLYREDILSLSTKEVLLLELLIKHKNKLLPKELIEEEVYEYDSMSPSALKNLILKLRKKLPSDTISTVGSHGYMLVVE
jgi:DNA-binding response OmpR family regulator